MDVEIFDTPPEHWDEFVLDHPKGKIYHLSQWNELIYKTFGHSIKYITLEENKTLIGVLPLTEFNSILFGRFSVSQPFINYGGPLVLQAYDCSKMLEFLQVYRAENKLEFVELRMDAPVHTSLPVKQHKVTFLLPLPLKQEVLFQSFKSKLRSQIRRPTKEGMFAVSGGVDLLDDYYNIFSINMRDLGTPVLPKSFFRNILEIFPENSAIVTVYTKEKIPAASSFLIYFRGICEIVWASSLKKFNRFSPNMLLYWESLKFAIEKKCHIFDFGRCSPDSGTYRFKKQWGSEEIPLYWYYVLKENESLPEINPQNSKYALAIKTWQHLPLSLTKIVGPAIVKNIP